jgi:small subunit ribosomal protein S10
LTFLYSSSVDVSELEHEEDDMELSPAQQAHLEELAAACETQEELDELLSSPDLQYLLSLQELQDLVDTPEPIISSLPIPGKSMYQPIHHKPQWRIPVATITFKGYDTERLTLFSHFAVHVASALGIPTSKVYALPKQRRLWTVLRSPFIYKKAQENFERITHSRGVKAWDAHPEIVTKWAQMLRVHAMPGVGMRVVRWTREEIGGGSSELKKVEGKLEEFERGDHVERVRRLGEKIIETELAVAEPEMEVNVGTEKTAEAP